jgi:hypothetical protein
LSWEVDRPFGRADFESMNDTTGMDTSQKSRIGKKPGPQDKPLKEAEGPLKKKATPSGPKAEEKAPQDETDESLAQDEEPGTFDRVYEHGRQMGF